MTILTEEGQTIDRDWWIFFWAAMGVLAIVTLLVLYAVVRFRRRDHALPRQVHHSVPVEVLYTALPVLLVAALTAVTLDSLADIEDVEEPDVVVDVVGYQWQWQFQYPESGVVVTGVGRDARPVLALPSDSVVRFRLTSLDVIHSFWIPEFRFKRDLWPGEVQEFDVRMLDRTGEFPDAGICGEFCGLDHASMRFSVLVLEPDEFDRWLAAGGDGTPAVVPDDAPVDAEEGT